MDPSTRPLVAGQALPHGSYFQVPRPYVAAQRLSSAARTQASDAVVVRSSLLIGFVAMQVDLLNLSDLL